MTDIDTVRLLTGLLAGDLPDASITQLLALNDGSVRLSAADALETVASQLTSVESDDISIDGSKRATILMARAARLRDQAAEEAGDGGFFFGIVDQANCHPELTEWPRY